VEALGEVGAEGDRQLERLSAVPEVGLAGGRELAGISEWDEVRADAISPLVGCCEAERREDSGCRGNEDGTDLELLRERACVQGPGAAEGDESEVSRVESLLDGDDAQRPGHLGVDDVDHVLRSEGAERAARGVGIERDPARKALRQATEQEVRVRHGRAQTAAPVARRSREGARALGPDVERSTGVPPRDGAAPRADGVYGKRRQADRVAGDDALVFAPGRTVHDRADVG
jgi:hypothetical protein